MENLNERNDKEQIDIIYKAYKDFYKKEPNFNKENLMNITIEIQSMVYLLREYNVNLGGEGFVKDAYKELNLQMDMKIQDIIVFELIGKQNNFDDSLKFNERTNKYIDIIGTAVRNEINNTSNPIESLRIILYILYNKKYVSPWASDEDIMKIVNCDEIYINKAHNLLNTIKVELCKDNFDEKNIESIRKMIFNESRESNKVAVKSLLK